MCEVKCSTGRDMENFHAQVSTVPFRPGDDSKNALRLLASDRDFSNSLVTFLVITGTGRELNETLNELSMSGVSCVIYYVSYEPDVSSIISLQDQIVVPVHPEDDLTAVM